MTHESTTEEKKLMVINWDKSEVVKNEIEFMKQCQKDGEEALEGLSEDEMETMVWNDEDLFLRASDDVEQEIDAMLDDFNKNKKAYEVNINNFGWRNLSGHKTLDSDIDGHSFIGQILPETECTFTITQYADRIEILNYHHDSPTGETYYITLAKK